MKKKNEKKKENTELLITLHSDYDYLTDIKVGKKGVLTDAREQIIEPLFREKRVLQTPEVEFENASH